MNIKEWAKKLNGREYLKEITSQEEKEAKEDGVIIAFGYSDDNLEFRGAIDDEIGAYDGATVKLTKDLTVFSESKNAESFNYNRHEIQKMPKVKAISCPTKNEETIATWEITTKLPHEKFKIYEDGDLFCIGIVINVNSVLYYKGK
jgi:hypothetical protein